MNRHFVTLLIGLTISMPWPASAQQVNPRLPISLDADSTNYDGKNEMLLFRGLRLTQGTIGIEADEGKATRLDFADSNWVFSGNVVIDVDSAHIECDSANLRFVDHELKIALITGSPARFRLVRPEDNSVTEGQAGKLTYDLVNGVIEFSEQASINEGGNQISSNFLVYSLRDKVVNAQAAPDGGDKVKITFTPPETELPDGVAANGDEPAGVEDNQETDAAPPAEDEQGEPQ
jgi:lipopolysaccharide transport protein LptA